MNTSNQITRRIFVGKIATLFSGSIVARGMTALALLLTARQLGVDGYGQYAASIALTSLASIAFCLGMDVWLLRQGGGDSQNLPAYAGSVLGLKFLLGLSWMLIFFLLAPILKQETYPATLLRWSALLIWLDSLLTTTLTAFKAELKNWVPSVLEASADVIWCAITIVLILLGHRQAEIYLIVRVLVSAVALSLSWGLLCRQIGLCYKAVLARQALRGAMPYASSEFLAIITARADVVIVGLLLGKTATGLYSPSVGLISIATLAPLAIYMVAVPVLSNLFQIHPDHARRMAARTTVLSLGVGALLSAGFALGAPWIVMILGDSFQGSVDILRIISLVIFFTSGSHALAAVIVAADQQAKRPFVQATAAGFNLLANILVIDWLGIKGVAGVYVITELIQLTGYIVIVWRNIWKK